MRLQQASDRFRRLGNVFYYADALASLCELYYARSSESDLDKVTRTAEAAKKVDNGLIDYHLARISLTVGKAYVDGGRLSEAFDAFCTASERALKFNRESFGEVSEEVVGEIDRIAREIAPESALQFCDAYIGLWSTKDLTPAKKEPVEQMLEAIRRKQEGIRALMPIP